jgi:hypothetical protein
VLVTVWVTGPPETVTTRVLTKVVWESELVSAVVEGELLVTTAAWVEVRVNDVDAGVVDEGVDDGVVDGGVEEGVEDVDVGVGVVEVD